MRDRYGDLVQVHTSREGNVILGIHDDYYGQFAEASFTPDAARKLIKNIRNAIKENN